jgi:hypothetical protein
LSLHNLLFLILNSFLNAWFVLEDRFKNSPELFRNRRFPKDNNTGINAVDVER